MSVLRNAYEFRASPDGGGRHFVEGVEVPPSELIARLAESAARFRGEVRVQQIAQPIDPWSSSR